VRHPQAARISSGISGYAIDELASRLDDVSHRRAVHRRGYKLEGFYTPEEFADRAPEMFPGKNFDARAVDRNRRHPAGSASRVANGKFHSYEETLAEFKSLAHRASRPGAIFQAGPSFEGREIFVLKISKDARWMTSASRMC